MTSSQPDFNEAVALFNNRQFFECHEVLEDLWRPLLPGPEKQFLQGLLQIGVGFHHLLRLNYLGAKNLLEAGIEKMEATAAQSAYQPPIQVSPLLAASRKVLVTVLLLGPERLFEFPESALPLVELV